LESEICGKDYEKIRLGFVDMKSDIYETILERDFSIGKFIFIRALYKIMERCLVKIFSLPRENPLVFSGSLTLTAMVLNGPIFNWENYYRLFSTSIRKKAK